MSTMPLQTVNLLEAGVASLPFTEQVQIMINWAKEPTSRFVCVANTHMLVEAHQNPQFKGLLHCADLITPDGMPLVWMMRLLGVQSPERVAGMDILMSICQTASRENVSVYFLGSQSEILALMKQRLTQEFPNLQIAGMQPLPFHPLSTSENEQVLNQIKESGASIVFVSLGCPKQEQWMARQRGKLPVVMIGLGGVFPIYAGIHKRAPRWLRDLGLEWFYRLHQEPRRLWRRYGTTIPMFIFLAIRQLLQAQTNTDEQSTLAELKCAKDRAH
ncbi:MAG TPA: WecB/TagA/CpsF family glycosyltransferase [Stenomitos sp.]